MKTAKHILCRQIELNATEMKAVRLWLFKAGVNVKAVLTPNLSVYFINHCLAVLCKFWVNFRHFGKELFFSERIG